MRETLSNRAWGRAIVDGLRRLGAERFFLSPGARCAPLAAALKQCDVTVHYDERGTGFAALGCAMATGRPAVCVTTSGSAVANLLPACVEAFHSNIPLVMLTADRPPELRGTGANQTIEQPGLFGGFVRFAADLPTPQEEDAVLRLGRQLSLAMQCATGPQPGPVHLNVPFREPLLEADDRIVEIDFQSRGSENLPALVWPPGFDFSKFISARGVVVIGRLPAGDQEQTPWIIKLANHLGWPVIADAASGGRLLPGIIRHVDWVLHRPDVPAPERVLHFGGALVSKRLGKWLSCCKGADCLQVRIFPERLDPWEQSPLVLRCGVQAFCEAVSGLNLSSHVTGWAECWHRADHGISCLLDRELTQEGDFNEPEIIRMLSKTAVDIGCPLFVGNSMPIRDFDSCAAAVSPGIVKVFTNRGASGIDGNIATVAGLATGCASPILAVMGDLAALHDLNSLPLLAGLPVTLVIINNGGGGIFRFLPIDVDERLIECPHDLKFQGAAEQFGIPYRMISSRQNLHEAFASYPNGPRLFECRTDRAANHALHVRIAAACCSLPLSWRA